MKIVPSIFKVVRQMALIGSCCFILIACDSGNAPAPVPPIDDGQHLNIPVIVGSPEVRDGVTLLPFVVQEDSILRGQFYVPADTPQTDPVFIKSLPRQGLLTLDISGEAFVYTPDENYFGGDEFRYVTKAGLEVVVEISVQPVADAPVLVSNLPQVLAQGKLFVFTLEYSDADADEVRFSAVGLPDWLALDAASGTLSGTPAQTDIGVYDGLVFRVTDSTGLFDEVTDVRIEVIDVNDAPTLNLSQLPRELNARESISARVYPYDPDGDEVTLAIEPNRFIQGVVDQGTITLTAADVNDVTHVNIVIKATDAQGSVAREIVALTIIPVTDSGRGLTLSGSEEGRGVHLVILGDGYASDQQALFRTHVESAIQNMHSDAGISAHMEAFNIHMISTVSLDSGADDSDLVDSRNTAYDSAYNCRSIARLVCANTLSMLEDALQEYPFVDQIVLLVNDLRYGGSGNSGGSVAVTSAYYPEIALHEMGHSLADLADEYVDITIQETTGLLPFEEGRYPNVTALVDPAEVPWAHWIDPAVAVPSSPGEPGVGLFEGGLYRESGVFRATYDSRMRSFDASFGPVNSEQWVLRLYTLTEGIRGYSPLADSLSVMGGELVSFRVSPLFEESVQQVEWSINGNKVNAGEDLNSLETSFATGQHTVTVTITDVSGAIRVQPPHAGIFTHDWLVEAQ